MVVGAVAAAVVLSAMSRGRSRARVPCVSKFYKCVSKPRMKMGSTDLLFDRSVFRNEQQSSGSTSAAKRTARKQYCASNSDIFQSRHS